MLAIKFYDDTYYNNEYYSKIGGISCRELNRLEAELLDLLAYDLHVQPEVYERYALDLLTQVPVPVQMVDPAEKGKAFPQTWSQSSLKTVPSINDICPEAVQ